ncbi:baseplate protein [Chromobacterium phragmitis]|uniref:Baseplate protein n=1 Tax=Chromobacterium phragmitis TaxID=2202141 RepID=A0A344UIJ1_9NEIS|nr:GPW/gp25 family protein [Chromobacterium phragmitis]AXE29698.1 baseplate protein [Chromobacterium phragmitis]AXE35089.1 baseplate protein [Chromobacterium phragmitis]
MTQLTDISSLHWQPALQPSGAKPGANVADIVENLDDIHQALRIILGTPKGSDPLRPEFGSDLFRYLDYPVDRARPHVVREAVAAISHPLHGEPRVQLLKVLFSVAADGSAHLCAQWKLADGVIRETELRL